MLDINNIKGNVPKIVWGGTQTTDSNKDIAISLYNLSQSGIEPTDDAIEELSEKFGFGLQKVIEENSDDNEEPTDNQEEKVVEDNDKKELNKEDKFR